ncbi:hypothetical protein [Flavobacterium sp. 3HN19-14]|uniref:hypothetical protein n=1 Tax=Flavobacterium sp. 3HN19-14 TaxID=3448133 RepID=UPI003EE3831D
MFKVKDSSKGKTIQSHDYLMDFLFYKKSLAAKPDEDAFYKEVTKLFLKKYGLSEKSTLDEILTCIRGIRNAPPIREIFNKAKSKYLSRNIVVDNLNITALCLLHLNKPALCRMSGHPDSWFMCRVDNIYHFKSHANTLVSHSWKGYRYSGYHGDLDYFGFPNVLLTSDIALLNPTDVSVFRLKYQNFLGKNWLTQIPHHGSRHNSGEEFFNLVQRPYNVLFVNYGLNNGFKHPSQDIMPWIQDFLVPIHERQGMRFHISP